MDGLLDIIMQEFKQVLKKRMKQNSIDIIYVYRLVLRYVDTHSLIN